MTFDEDAVARAATELDRSPDEVKAALLVWQTYRKYQKQNKQRRKLHQAHLLAQRQLEEEKRQHPEQCFCLEDGLEVERNPDKDNILRYVTRYYPYDYEQKSPYQVPIYECSRCGKEYIISVAIA